ncbi:MAG: hypothetical protein ACOH5I_05205 [Oligoflexus sp.]
MRRLVATALTICWFLDGSKASGSPTDTRWTHFGLRPLGMGNAYVAVADDFNALFYNPAGLARLKTWDGEFINPGFEISKNVKNLAEELQDNTKDGGTGVEGTLDLIERNAGEDQYFGLQLTPHLVFPHFGFGIGLQLDVSAAWHRQISVDLRVGPDLVAPVAFAMNFLDDRLSIGAAVKFRARLGLDSEFSLDDIEALSGNDSDAPDDPNKKEIDDYIIAGTGIGGDVGLLFTPIETMKPTIGVSVTDIGGTSFEKIGAAGNLGSAPQRILPSVNVGLSARPYEAGRMYLQTSVDMHSINQPYSYSRKLQLGTEFGYGSLFKAQAGLYQGYLTAGLQLDVGIINLRLVTYAVEYGKYAGAQENRRYAAQVKLLL